jgi:hypothetical protein
MARGESATNAAAQAPASAAVIGTPQRRGGAQAPVVKASADAANLAAESRALAAVQRALRDGEHAAALRLLDEQDRIFARGLLGEERAAARVIARCGAGRTLEAERARAAFEARYPRSPLLTRLESACLPSGAP